MQFLLPILITCLIAVVKILLICLCGVAIVFFPKENPLLNSEGIRTIAKLTQLLFLPALIVSSLLQVITLDLLGKVGQLIVFSFGTCAIGYFLALATQCFVDKDMRLSYRVCMSSHNAVSLPLMIVQTLCEQDFIADKEFDGNHDRCFKDGSAMLFVNSVGWYIFFWSICFPQLQLFATSATETTSLTDNNNNKEEEEESDKKEISTFELEGRSTISFIPEALTSSSSSSCSRFVTVLKSFNLMCVIFGVAFGLISPIKNIFFSPSSPFYAIGSFLTAIGTPTVTLSTLTMASSLGLLLKSTHLDHFKLLTSRTTIIWFLVSKFIILPSIMSIILLIVNRFTKQLLLVNLIIVIQSTMPSAEMVLVTYQRLAMSSSLIAKISQVYIFMYLASMVSIIVFISIAGMYLNF